MKPLGAVQTLLVWSLAICGSWLLAALLVLAIGLQGLLWIAGIALSIWALRWMWTRAFQQESKYVDEQEDDMRAFARRFNENEIERRASASASAQRRRDLA